MTVIDAVFERGVFRPVTPVNLPEQERVRIRIETAATRIGLVDELLAEVDAVHAGIGGRVYFDSTADIAEDRRSGHRVG